MQVVHRRLQLFLALEDFSFPESLYYNIVMRRYPPDKQRQPSLLHPADHHGTGIFIGVIANATEMGLLNRYGVADKGPLKLPAIRESSTLM